jgi:hypothetical protein
VQGRYLRKKYKDPITNDDFIPIGAAGAAAGQVGVSAQPSGQGQQVQAGPLGRGQQPGASTQRPTQTTSPFASSAFGPESGNVAGGIIGVASKSKEESIRIYQGRTHYNEWQFLYVNAQPGGPGGRGVPGGPGGQPVPGGPGGRGRGGDRGRGPNSPFNPGGRPFGRPGGPG